MWTTGDLLSCLEKFSPFECQLVFAQDGKLAISIIIEIYTVYVYMYDYIAILFVINFLIMHSIFVSHSRDYPKVDERFLKCTYISVIFGGQGPQGKNS